MKNPSLYVRSIVTAELVLLMGCACEPAKPPVPAAPRAAAAPAVVPRRAPKEILEAAAAQVSAPFEGEGWQPIFDGKTLAGWRETDFAGHGEVECQSGMIVL